MANRVDSSFPKGGHSATHPQRNYNEKHTVKHHRSSYTKTSNRKSYQNYRLGTVNNEELGAGALTIQCVYRFRVTFTSTRFPNFC